MLGLGTRLFISPESSYGVENPLQYTNNATDGSGNYKDMHTYYIMNDRITTTFNQDEINYISDHRGRRNVFHENVNNVSGNFSFNLQHNMLKLFSLITGHNHPSELWYDPVPEDNYKNTLSFRTQELTTVTKAFLEGEGITLNPTNYYNEPNVYPDETIVLVQAHNPIENPIQSMTLMTTGGDHSTEYPYKFHQADHLCLHNFSYEYYELYYLFLPYRH